MKFIDDLDQLESERLIDEMSKLRHGMAVGNFDCYVQELEKRSFSRPAVQFMIGLCAIFWSRASCDGMQFDFHDELHVVSGGETASCLLSELPSYAVVEKRSSKIGSDWINAMIRKYSSEHAELCTRFDAGPIIGEIELEKPAIHVDVA